MKLNKLIAALFVLSAAPAFAQTYNVDANHTYPSLKATTSVLLHGAVNSIKPVV